ncbi:hypothetical protein [Candidatus Poriferisodalis sp.]|uniref:hypothetical protein n=1 Tax=Candidatus Poriferisodalis sp. TaxID=3101277 RepID=UPI003AF8E61F
MKTRRSSASRLLAGASALLLVLFLPSAPAEAADNGARQEVVPTVTITAGATTHNEPDGPMSFTLHASPVPANNLEVQLDSRQTGVVFTDAIERSFTETIPAGEASYSFDFIIVNDLVVEPVGVVTITIADSEATYEVGSESEAQTALIDDDVPITVSWDASTVHVSEAAGSVTVPFFIRVHDGNTPGTFEDVNGLHEGVAFLYTTAPVTADPTADFGFQSRVFTFEVGSFTVDSSGDYTLTGEIEIEITDDTEDEPGETFVLYFESPLPQPLDIGDTVIPTDRKTIVIADNDGVNNPPQFVTTPSELSIPEDAEVGTLIGAPFEATDYDGHEVTLLFTGVESEFELDAATKQIRIAEELDFETVPDYDLEFAAVDTAGGVTFHTVSVDVTNVDEPGLVELAPMAPEEGAMVEATLSDVDGPSDDMTWEWSESAALDGSFDPIDGQTEDHYMPTVDDVGMYLRATVTYADGEGAGKSADATTSEPVTARQDEDNNPPQPPWPPPDFCGTHPDTVADASTPLSVAVGGSASDDFCGKDDADWVAVDLVAGQAYRIEGTFNSTDGERRIFIAGMHDPDGQLITGSHSFDGNPYGTSNTSGYINFRPTETGTHYIEVGDMGWFHFRYATGPLSWEVEVHEIDLPPDDVPGVEPLTLEFNNYGQFVDEFLGTVNTHGDRDTFAIDAVAGHTYYIQMYERNRSGIFNCIHGIASAETPDERRPGSRECWHEPGWRVSRWFSPGTGGRYLVTIGSDNGTGDYRLRVHDTTARPPTARDTTLPPGDLAQDTGTEGLIYINDSWVTGTAVSGVIDLAGDKDWFRVELEGGRRYQIDAQGEGSGVGTLGNSKLWLHDAHGQRISGAFDGGSGSHLEAHLVLEVPTSGTYFIAVFGSTYHRGTYALSVIDLEDLYTTHRPS